MLFQLYNFRYQKPLGLRSGLITAVMRAVAGLSKCCSIRTDRGTTKERNNEALTSGTYAEWLSEAKAKIRSNRPDVDVELLDPNETYKAWQSGTSVQLFTSGHLPLVPRQSTTPFNAPVVQARSTDPGLGNSSGARVKTLAQHEVQGSIWCPRCGARFGVPQPWWVLVVGVTGMLLCFVPSILLLVIPFSVQCPECWNECRTTWWQLGKSRASQ